MWQIFQFPLCPFSRKVRLLLGEKAVAYDLVRESPWEHRDEFIDMNPTGRTPVVRDHERDITLIAPKDILLTAAQNRQTLENKNSGRQTGVGVTVGFGQQTGISFQLGASRQQGQADGSEITHDNTQITAGNTLRLQSGNDTTLSGAQLAAKRLEAQIGGDLAIETRQDQNYYQNRQKSGGFAVSLCLPPLCYGMSSGSLSAASQKIDHHYQSAVGQSGIVPQPSIGGCFAGRGCPWGVRPRPPRPPG